MKLSTNPPRGMYDFDPKEFKLRKYIYDTWRSVCLSYGYEEYLTPVLENAEIYRAKSGEDVGGKELMVFSDKTGKELAMRPEMTPSVTRLVSKNYTNLKKPVRYFSIANFFRNEKPQRGRNREFWQLNYDIFGSSSLNADIEVIEVGLNIMLAFNPPKDSFKIYINNRKLIDDVLKIAEIESNNVEVVRVLDKYEKLKIKDFNKILAEKGLNKDQIEVLQSYISAKDEKDLIKNLPKLKLSQGLLEVIKILKYFKDKNLLQFVQFNPKIIRGFDYYDGTVFEVFDLNKENTRSLFGGGRYNGLSTLFSNNNFDAVGAAPGDETLKLFLQSWGLDKNIADDTKTYFAPLLSSGLLSKLSTICDNLRSMGLSVVLGLDVVGMSKALNEANKKGYSFVVIFGENEAKQNCYLLKNMKTGGQTKVLL